MTAVLYRTNAQSRAIEDALMREGVAYRIIGGVRFYERKEIKDALAYLRLVINPHDDVSFRRVVNVPARGIGKSVLDALEAVEIGGGDGECAAPRRRACRRRRRGRCGRGSPFALDRRLLPPRALTALKAFRDLMLGPRGGHDRRVSLDRARPGARSLRLPAAPCATSRAKSRKAASRT